MGKVLRNFSGGMSISNNLRSLCRILILIALIIDLYLAFIGISGESVIGCGPNSGCDLVMQSKSSKLLGIPLSLFALIVYVGLLHHVGKLKENYDAGKQRRAWRAIISISTLVVGAGLWFIILQVFVINAICPFCMAAHACGMTASGVLLFNVPLMDTPKGSSREKIVYVSPRRMKKRVVGALALLGIFIGAQIINNPTTHVIKPIIPQSVTNKMEEIKSETTQENGKVLTNIVLTSGNVQPISNPNASPSNTVQAVPPNIVSVQGSNSSKTGNNRVHRINISGAGFEFNLDEVPYIGSVEAPTKILSLFDYTYHYCREMHAHLMTIANVYSNKVGIISLPMPLDATCNPLMPRTPKAHINACEYAKIGLAIWRANRSLHPKFEKYVFDGQQAPSIENVRIFASNLIGSEALEKALSDPWVNNMIKLSSSIFATNVFYLGQSQMPQVIVGTNLISGYVQNAGVLVEELEKQYKISDLK
ncbi:MAG: hypothetical protein N2487_01505 [Verrucomicrobiae bacterium]|nr:hypothetical protein [Verrucomicrobiae bacterium]